MHNILLLVQSDHSFVDLYSFFTQKTVCANDSFFKLPNIAFLTPWVIFRIFAQNRSPSD